MQVGDEYVFSLIFSYFFWKRKKERTENRREQVGVVIELDGHIDCEDIVTCKPMSVI